MKIIFSNEQEFEYFSATHGRDYKRGENLARLNMAIEMPLAQTSYDEIHGILSDVAGMQSFTLVGDAPINEKGEEGEPVVNVYTDFNAGFKITTEDDVISFTMFKKHDMEIENEQAIATIDALLIAMEV